MPKYDIANAEVGDLESTETKYSVDAVTTDGPSEQDETFYDNEDWSQQLGYYKKIPELRQVIDAKARWTVGKGYNSNPITEILLSTIKGFGKDTLNTILENLIRTYHIGGDAFAEIIRDGDQLVNLKPLDSGVMRIVVDKKGIVKRYEQMSKVGSSGKVIQKFQPEDIFHLSRNRLADEIHGISMVDSLIDIILARNEAMDSQRTVMRRYIKPRFKFKLDTDDETEIKDYKTKMDKATNNAENIYEPKDVAESELISVPTNATMNPLPWIERLNNYFYQAAGVPQIIVGGASEVTEASSKILYLAFQQTIEEEQLYIEEQFLSQLNLEITLEFPASLQNELLSDKAKSETMQASTPEDTGVTNMGVSQFGNGNETRQKTERTRNQQNFRA